VGNAHGVEAKNCSDPERVEGLTLTGSKLIAAI